ncbi:DUF6002 family protein [Spirillospora sp. NBC_00431]
MQGRVSNLLGSEYDFLTETLEAVAAEEAGTGQAGGGRRNGGASPGSFRPPWAIPAPSDRLTEYFDASTVTVSPTQGYGGREINVLDLRGNPRTRTTKTLPSLVMVARAVEHIQRTGEGVTLLTPTSANKGTALRDAVLRAIEAGLVDSGRLNIVTVVPHEARGKLWSSRLSEDADLAVRNPVAVLPGGRGDDVKRVAKTWHDQNARRYFESTGARLWYTLDIRNYNVGDALRARFEHRYLRPVGSRVHVHAVSSAYGLLGHNFGARLVGDSFAEAARYFLVQHLGTPDMVLHLRHWDHTRDNLPEYRYHPESGLYVQRDDPHFPYATGDPREFLESTFYSSAPPTSEVMTPIIHRQGGGGIVVSLFDCLTRYHEVRGMLAPTGIQLPADPRKLREWSLVMAMTGMLTALDRGILPNAEDVLVHASGSYSTDDFVPIRAERLRGVTDPDDLTPVMYDAAASTVTGGTP